MLGVAAPERNARPFWTALRDRWWIVALCTLVAAGVTYSTVVQRPGQYQATAVLGLSNQYLDRDIFDLSPAIKTTEEVLAQQPGQLDDLQTAIETTKNLGLQPATDARDVAAATSVSVDRTLFLPIVQGRDRDPVRAAELANVFADTVVARRARQDERRMRRALSATEGSIKQAARRLEDADPLETVVLSKEVARLSSKALRLRMLLVFRPPTIEVIRHAPVATSRTRPPALNLSLAGGAFGLMMGICLLAWREYRDARPRPDEVLGTLRAAILTDLPKSALLPGARPRGPQPSEFDALDAVRRLTRADHPHAVVAVTEPITLGRAAAFSQLLAETSVQLGARTLLATNDPHLQEQADGDFVIERYPIEVGDVAQRWLDVRRERFDLVIVDLPSPVGSAAALEFASLADSVVAVWLPNSIDRRQLSRLGQVLRRSDIHLDGVVRVGGRAT